MVSGMTKSIEYGSRLTVPAASRPIGMNRGKQKGWRRVAIVAALLCAAASVKVMANPAIRRPVAHFIYFYQQADDAGFWERIVYSALMTKSTEPSS